MHYAKGQKVADSIPSVVAEFLFFGLGNRYSRNMALGFTQLITEIITRNFPGRSKARAARKSDSLNAICEPSV
jgi:hypothetical protein